MSDTAEAQRIDDPADLERRYIEGDPDVTPEKIEAAERQSRWQQLQAKREARQAEKAADKAAKAKATKLRHDLLTALESAEDELPVLFAAARDAAVALVERVDQRNAEVARIAHELDDPAVSRHSDVNIQRNRVRFLDEGRTFDGPAQIEEVLAAAVAAALAPHEVPNRSSHGPTQLYRHLEGLTLPRLRDHALNGYDQETGK